MKKLDMLFFWWLLLSMYYGRFCVRKNPDDYLRKCSKWPSSFTKHKVALCVNFWAALIRVSLKTFRAHNFTIFFHCSRVRLSNRIRTLNAAIAHLFGFRHFMPIASRNGRNGKKHDIRVILLDWKTSTLKCRKEQINTK